MTKLVTLYNHKGGVSKTTTTFNIAHLLVDAGYKVLVVDADPQCNLTELVMVGILEAIDAEEAEKKEEKELPGRSLLDILKPRISGDTSTVTIKSADTVKIKDRFYLIRGDVSLSSIEESLAEAHIQRFAAKTHEKRTYVALADTLRRFGSDEKFDYILIDVGPSSGALTRSCFLACDGFFVPTAPDRFNVQALSTLSTIIDRWISEHEEVYKNFVELKLPVFLGKPKFLGLILQSYSTYKGEPKKSFTYWIEKLPHQFDKYLLPVLKKHSSGKLDLTGGLTGATAIISRIPYFESLAPLLQATGKAVFQIDQDDTELIEPKKWRGNVWTQAQERMVAYKAQIEKIAERLKQL